MNERCALPPPPSTSPQTHFNLLKKELTLGDIFFLARID